MKDSDTADGFLFQWSGDEGQHWGGCYADTEKKMNVKLEIELGRLEVDVKTKGASAVQDASQVCDK